MRPPKWTVYAQRQDGKWMNTRYHFADSEEEARLCYEWLSKKGYTCVMRPWTRDDLPHMGVLDRQELDPPTVSMEHAYRKELDKYFLKGW